MNDEKGTENEKKTETVQHRRKSKYFHAGTENPYRSETGKLVSMISPSFSNLFSPLSSRPDLYLFIFVIIAVTDFTMTSLHLIHNGIQTQVDAKRK